MVLFNNDTLTKIISYLPSLDVLNLAVTSKSFGIHHDDEKLSVIKKSAHILVQGIAIEEQLAALPNYDGESSLADYHYLQLIRVVGINKRRSVEVWRYIIYLHVISTKRTFMLHFAKDMIYNTEQKVDKTSTINNCKEVVLFNSDTLSKIISYLPSVDLLNLSLTCKKFGISNNYDDSIIKMSADILVHEIATEEELATLPYYNGENSLEDHHYLQFMRGPLTFDQLVGGAEYVNNGDKTCVRHTASYEDDWGTAISNNILRAGKHYASFKHTGLTLFVGVMRPGKANEEASGTPLIGRFYQNFSRRMSYGEEHNNNNVHCCMLNRYCCSSDWNDPEIVERWEGMEIMSSDDEIGMLLDLDEGTLSVYKNGRKLGVMKSGLAGPYCWVVSMYSSSHVRIKREMIPPN